MNRLPQQQMPISPCLPSMCGYIKLFDPFISIDAFETLEAG